MICRLSRCVIAAIAVLSLTCSCNKEEVIHGGIVSFSISTGSPITRADSPGDGNVADGGGIFIADGKPDLIILIADSNGTIVKKYDGTINGTDGDLQSLSDTQATIAFDFTDQDTGEFSIYAFGNAQGLWSMTSDGSNVLSRSDLINTLSSKSDIEGLQFRPLVADTAPSLIDNRLPITAKGSFTVSAENNGQVSLELIRCVAKVTAEIVNNTGAELSLTDYQHAINGICSDRAYVLENPSSIPDGTVSGAITATEASLTIPAFIQDPDDPESTIPGRYSQSWYVFPSLGPYTADISFTSGSNTYNYTALPITDYRRQDIMSLSRNQRLHIVTRISKGMYVSFNFEVADWLEKTEEVQFD